MKKNIPETIKVTVITSREDGAPVFQWQDSPGKAELTLENGQFLLLAWRDGNLVPAVCDGYISAAEPLGYALNDKNAMYAMLKFGYPADYADFDPYTVNAQPWPWPADEYPR